MTQIFCVNFMIKLTNKDILESIEKLDGWIEINGWAGYDPYDLLGTNFFIWFQRKFQRIRPMTFLMENFINRFPLQSRKLFNVKPEINAKAMALFARGYLLMYKKTKKNDYIEKAKFCLKWLIDNKNKEYNEYCWGYPFDWQSREFKPRGTPSGIVTSIAAHAFLDAYEIIGEKKYLRVAKSCCDFILNKLNRYEQNKDNLCFSYTPIDNEYVHNINIFCSSVLFRTWKYTRIDIFKEIAFKSLNFTIKYQNKDGSWYYWAPPSKINFHIDNYHTGFILECLEDIKNNLDSEFLYKENLNRGILYYTNELFLNNGIPKMKNDSVFPIDIHSCAQGIITLSHFKNSSSDYEKLLQKTLKWTIKKMQDDKGYFYYRKYKKGLVLSNFIDRTPYIRWSQAWMLRALSCVL